MDRILEGETRVLNTVPLALATTNRIAEVAGVGIGSLYQYFDSSRR
ncbi:TetR family transcriptional regulator [Bradyrhizobium prioriisuperbiae]|nr:TetR family transcriptional regulator [Bradyrhizobium prioritasuperba]